MKALIEKLKGTLSPYELSDILLKLSGEYAFLASEWEEIQKEKPGEWLKLRAECTSDTQAERKFARSEIGQKEIILKSQLKTAEKVMSAIKARLRIAEGEAKNQF